jgi:threonine 3-dehydrogenase
MGADVILNDNEVDVVAEIKKDNPDGVDIVLEMAGSEAAINQSLSLVRKGGRISAFGIAKDTVTIDYNTALTFGGARIHGINGRRLFEDWFMVKNFLASGRLNIGPVVTHTLKLSDFEKGFDLMNNRPKKCGKVVLIPPKI